MNDSHRYIYIYIYIYIIIWCCVPYVELAVLIWMYRGRGGFYRFMDPVLIAFGFPSNNAIIFQY